MIWFTPILRPNSPINSKFLSHNDQNQYCSMCFQGSQVSWYFCGSSKKARETTHRNWNLSIPVPLVGNCFHRGFVPTRVFFVWRVTGGDINYCTVLQSVACSETLTLWLGLWFDIIFLYLLHGVSATQFSRRFETAIWCEGKEAKADTLTDFFWVFNVAYFILQIFTENFFFFFNSVTQASLFIFRIESLR